MRRKVITVASAIFIGLLSWAIPQYLEVNDMITQENSYWLLISIGIGAFIVACILVWGFWPIIKRIWFHLPVSKSPTNSELSIEKANKYLLDQRPIPTLVSLIRNNQAILKIHNDGAMATFTATAKIIDGVQEGELYGLELRPEHCINNNGEAEISLADIQNGFLLLYSKQGPFQLLSEDDIEQHKLRERFPKMANSIKAPEDGCVLEVTITSNPTPITPIKTKEYILAKDDQKNLVFTEVELAVHKEDFQSKEV